MKILLIKQSSLGDLIHCFSAISDLHRACQNVKIDWLVDQQFKDVPQWHSGINESISINLREWQGSMWQSRHVIKDFFSMMRKKQYDVIIDAQALIKSVVVARLVNKCRAPIVGLDRSSIRTEKICANFYHKKIRVPLQMHAIERVRHLFAGALGYSFRTDSEVSFSLRIPDVPLDFMDTSEPYVVGIHATTWVSKHLPVKIWQDIARKIQENGKKLLLPWIDSVELQRAKAIQKVAPQTVIIAPKLSINQLANVIQSSQGVISVDTGFAHVAAALNIPIVVLYGSTDKNLTAAWGSKSMNLQSQFDCSPCMGKHCKYNKLSGEQPIYPPCYQEFSADVIWQKLVRQIGI